MILARYSLRHPCRAAALLLVAVLSMSSGASTVSAELVTFAFEGNLTTSPGPTLPLAVGQKVSGTYTFELNTPGQSVPSPNTFTFYDHAVKNITVKLDGFGTGGGSDGNILLGDPVQTSGSFNFLSDQYDMFALASGISVAGGSFGTRNLFSVSINLQDLDQQGLSNENLSPTPPSLAPFLDHATGKFDSDHAQILLTFTFPDNSRNSTAFQLTSLTLVPEPNLTWMALAILVGWTGKRIVRRARR